MSSVYEDLLDIDFGDYQSANNTKEENINIEESDTEDTNIYLGEKHQSKIGIFYDIEISKTFKFIKL